ncbi:ABC transporter substrate-binding protein [Dictyobacter arantiisoli]|uniref:Sugar ABC transporter substrate-binding protein n=1 Tax=Dictyobacter arantiisoli TaxID=2014874 RepID=A0A5A5TKX0_9CHLR|nr:extracellular solute-binding protein [Dictyobacter arantiisoli]GCF11584.1 sugar ABC transporter substrate-binding protein [Dictyobacter arantiisoli]
MPINSLSLRFSKAARGFLCTLTLFSVLCTLAACTSGTASGKIHLTMWYWNRSIDDSVIAQVGKQFPNIDLTAEKITDYDTKVRTTMAGHNGVPDILAVNANLSTYFPDENQFVDLRTLGSDALKSTYLPWKWNLGTTPTGRQIAIPMDTGPTALFYRSDIFAKAGLPTDPTQVTNTLKTWDDYMQAGDKIKQATNGKVKLIDNIATIYGMVLGQQPLQYADRSGKYIGDGGNVKNAWNTAIKMYQQGNSAEVVNWTNDWNAAISNGTVASFVGAVWMKQPLFEAAANTKGNWRVARTPGGDGNNGGSFLTIPAATTHAKEAYQVISWLQNPDNQLTAYKDLQLYPSALETLNNPALNANEDFFGKENTNAVFAEAAKNIPNFYLDANHDVVGQDFVNALGLVSATNKNPDAAWNDAQIAVQRDLLR